MEPSLVVIGVSYRTAALAVRERFWMDEADRIKALTTLVRSDGVDEVVVFSTCNRTEFFVWTQNPSEAANSVLRFLTREYDLKLSDWSNFYRLLDDAAMTHIFRVAAALDTQVFGEPDVSPVLTAAWYLAQKTGTIGCFLDAIIGRAIDVAASIANKACPANAITSIASAAIDQCREIFRDLKDRSVLIIGSGRMAETMALNLRQKAGVRNIKVTNRTSKRMAQLATVLKVETVPFEQRSKAIAEADIVIVATTARKIIIQRSEIETAMKDRLENPLVVIDVSVPRNVDPSIRSLDSVYLSDIDDFCENVRSRQTRPPLLTESEEIVRKEAAGFHQRLLSERVVPTITELRERLQEMCEQELTTLSDQFGPFTEDQGEAMRAYAQHISQRISAQIARQLKHDSNSVDAAQMVVSINKIFGDPRTSMGARKV